MDHPIRPYDSALDLDQVLRTWMEVGWIDSPDKRGALEAFCDAANVEVGLIDGEAECNVHWVPGRIRYQQTDLGLCPYLLTLLEQLELLGKMVAKRTVIS